MSVQRNYIYSVLPIWKNAVLDTVAQYRQDATPAQRARLSCMSLSMHSLFTVPSDPTQDFPDKNVWLIAKAGHEEWHNVRLNLFGFLPQKNKPLLFEKKDIKDAAFIEVETSAFKPYDKYDSRTNEGLSIQEIRLNLNLRYIWLAPATISMIRQDGANDSKLIGFDRREAYIEFMKQHPQKPYDWAWERSLVDSPKNFGLS